MSIDVKQSAGMVVVEVRNSYHPLNGMQNMGSAASETLTPNKARELASRIYALADEAVVQYRESLTRRIDEAKAELEKLESSSGKIG